MNHLMTNPSEISAFALAGNALVTLRSAKTEAHYTYKIAVAKDNPSLWFVSLLTGPQNEHDYTYLGIVRMRFEGPVFLLTAKSRLGETAGAVLAFRYFFSRVVGEHRVPTQLEVRHEGRCGRCGRTLTVPDSIDRGIGPECATQLAA